MGSKRIGYNWACMQDYLSGLPFPSPVDHILSDLSTMTCLSWVAPQAWLSFIELDKAVVLVWLDWLVFCDYGFSVSALWDPLAKPTILLGFLLPWTWGICSRLLQQSTAAAPYLGRRVLPHCNPSWPWMWTSSSRSSCTHTATTPWMLGFSWLISHASKVMIKVLQGSLQQNMWTMNLQMFKLVLEKAEEPEIKLPTSAGSWKKQESSGKTSISALLTMPKSDCVDHNKLGKILKEMGIPDHLTCLLRNLYASQEATVRTGHGTTDWFQIGKGVCQGCILSSCLFNLYAEYIMRNAGLEETSWNQECREKYQ